MVAVYLPPQDVLAGVQAGGRKSSVHVRVIVVRMRDG